MWGFCLHHLIRQKFKNHYTPIIAIFGTYKYRYMETKKYLIESKALSTGQVFIDPTTGITFGVRQISYERQATGTITYPDNSTEELVNVSPGQKWSFRFKMAEYELTLLELNYLYDTFKVQVKEK